MQPRIVSTPAVYTISFIIKTIHEISLIKITCNKGEEKQYLPANMRGTFLNYESWITMDTSANFHCSTCILRVVKLKLNLFSVRSCLFSVLFSVISCLFSVFRHTPLHW